MLNHTLSLLSVIELKVEYIQTVPLYAYSIVKHIIFYLYQVHLSRAFETAAYVLLGNNGYLLHQLKLLSSPPGP